MSNEAPSKINGNLPTARPPAAPRGMKQALQILNSPDPGGVLALAESIAAGVAHHDIAIETLFLTPQPGMSALTKLKGAFAASAHIVRGNYSAVIAYQAWPSIIVGLTGIIARRPRLIVHQTTVPSATSPPVRLLDRIIGSFGLYPVNIVNTSFTRSEYDSYPRGYRKHLRLIEHGVARPVLTCTRASTLQRYSIPDDRKIVLNTGRLVEQKNQDTLIRALTNLHECRLVVAGDGNLRNEFHALAKQLGVDDRVHLLGALPHDQTMELYGAADLFAFPSRHETFGISAVEAALLGIPTLVSDITVLQEVLTVEGQSPVAFIDATDVEAWTETLRQWCKDPPSSDVLQAFAKGLAIKYSDERMVEAYVELIGGR